MAGSSSTLPNRIVPAQPPVAPARIERVHDYLSGHLDREVDLEHLAGVACFSPFHFHRIYHALQGETVADSVRRMRLHRAALDLIDGDVPIARVAARAGYGSQAAFTRAFRSAYGAPPAAWQSRHAAPYRGAVEIRVTEPIPLIALAHAGGACSSSSKPEKPAGIAGCPVPLAAFADEYLPQFSRAIWPAPISPSGSSRVAMTSMRG